MSDASGPEASRVEVSDFSFRSFDDRLTLTGREYTHRAAASTLPVVCLPGHSRSTRDFEFLGRRLAGDEVSPRRVLAFNSRGRGSSQWDPDPANYTVAVELIDLVTELGRRGINRAVFVGTSRGGIVTALAAASHPGLVAKAVLNDVGPVLSIEGLLDIKSYLGKTPDPPDWPAAVAALRARDQARFTGLAENDWELLARMTFVSRDGRPVVDYDPKLGLAYESLTAESAPPPVWELYDSLQTTPTLLLRGANSPLLTGETAEKMLSRYQMMRLELVPGQGHPPALLPGPLLERVAEFILAP